MQWFGAIVSKKVSENYITGRVSSILFVLLSFIITSFKIISFQAKYSKKCLKCQKYL